MCIHDVPAFAGMAVGCCVIGWLYFIIFNFDYMPIYEEEYEQNTYPPRPKYAPREEEWEVIESLKKEIHTLGPSWNLFGMVDRMKFFIEKLEQLKNKRS